MNAFQLTALLPLLLGAVPAYLIANSIEREKNYSRLAGWDAEKFSNRCSNVAAQISMSAK